MLALLLVPVSSAWGRGVRHFIGIVARVPNYGGLAGVTAEIAASMLTRPTIIIAP